MGRIKEQSNAFKGNYHGILDHTGRIQVAKADVEQTVTTITNGEIYVRGVGKKYQVTPHKDLQNQIEFLETGDIAFVKFQRGKAYLVGFQKTVKMDENIVLEGDATLLDYFQQQKKISMGGGGLNG